MVHARLFQKYSVQCPRQPLANAFYLFWGDILVPRPYERVCEGVKRFATVNGDLCNLQGPSKHGFLYIMVDGGFDDGVLQVFVHRVGDGKV